MKQMKIHAVNRFGESPLNDQEAPDYIRAALASPEVRAISRLLAKCDVEIKKPLTIAEIDPKISHLTPRERIQIKASLIRCGASVTSE
jgi:hypothetical protein